VAAARSSGTRLPLRRGVLVGLACGAVMALLLVAGAFQTLDLRIHDWRYRLRGDRPASDRIALVEVDDATIRAYHAWPLPRRAFAVLVDALRESGCEACGFDLLFLGENSEDAIGDDMLAAVTAGRENLVHAITFLPEDASLGGGATPGTGPAGVLVHHGRPVARQRLAAARHVSLPYEALLATADALGHTVVAVDRDGVVRRIPLFVRYGEWAYPSLAIRLVESAARGDTTLPQFELAEDGVRLHWHGRQVRVPSDRDGATEIVFAGDRTSFPHTYSMLRVLQMYRDNDSLGLARAFGGKLVLVGVTAVEEVAADMGSTPFAEATPLVYIHANAVNAALTGRFLATLPSGWAALALLVFGAVLGALLSRLPLGRSALAAGGMVAVVAALDLVAFLGLDLDIPPTAGLLLPPLLWIAIQGALRRLSERQARDREKDLMVARSIQRHLLPSGPPRTPELDVFGVNLPAEAVGGDYYDWTPIGDDVLAVVVGDVSGHGVPAALLMSHLRASFHAEARPGRAPSEIVQSIHDSLARAAQPGKFATFFLALLSRSEPRMRYCNAGHNPPILLRPDGPDLLGATGLPLAMLEAARYGDDERPFGPGDTLVLYSDGIPEAPVKDDFYGDERLLEKVQALASRGRPAAEVGADLLADVQAQAGEALATDDVTLVIVRRL
jgi:serine phosphatase RsbU (regulator of sigma subunit)